MSKEEAKAAEVDSDDEEEVAPVEKEEEPEQQEDTTLANSDVVTKYQEAAKITQAALEHVTALCVPGAKLLDLCKAGDEFILEKTGAIYKSKGKNGKPVDRGIAFPVCISVNEYVCHYSPLPSEDKLPSLVGGDMVKIDLGAHIDGYIAVGAHTVYVKPASNDSELKESATASGDDSAASSNGDLSGARLNVLVAAWTAAEVAARLIKPGNKNTEVTSAIKKVADHFGVRPLSGIQMNQMKRYVIDGKKAIQLREDETKIEACEFEQFEVYCIDIALSTGEGNPRPTDLRTTVYKRQVDQKYGLKVKASRAFFNEVNKKFPTMPFSLRYLEGDETACKMGVRECVNHGLIAPYSVLSERAGDLVAHFKFTVLIMPSGTVRVTGLDSQAFAMFGPEAQTLRDQLPEEIKSLIVADESLLAAERRKAKKKAAAKRKKAAGSADKGDTEEA